MKKLFILILFVFVALTAHAKTLEAGIDFDWISKSQLQRDQNIQQINAVLFSEHSLNIPKKDFKAKYAPFLKDVNNKTNYINIKNDLLEDNRAKYSGFFLNNKMLYMYAIQYKINPKLVYYYDTMGTLRYVDVISENYPNYPYYSTQYRANGKIVSKIYFNSHIDQYMYNPDGTFKGRWFKDKMYDKNAKIIMTRSNY